MELNSQLIIPRRFQDKVILRHRNPYLKCYVIKIFSPKDNDMDCSWKTFDKTYLIKFEQIKKYEQKNGITQSSITRFFTLMCKKFDRERAKYDGHKKVRRWF